MADDYNENFEIDEDGIYVEPNEDDLYADSTFGRRLGFPLTDAELSGMFTAAASFPHIAEDWNAVEQNPPIKSIRYDLKMLPAEKRSAYRHFDLKKNLSNVKRALTTKKGLFAPGGKNAFEKAKNRVVMAYYFAKMTNDFVPDATAYNGSVISHWGEHADYIGAMQPKMVAAALNELADLRAIKAALVEKIENGESVTADELDEIVAITANLSAEDWENYGALIGQDFTDEDEDPYDDTDEDIYDYDESDNE